MNVTELKEKLLTSLDLWADARISDMVKETPALAIPSVYMKRASHNIIWQVDCDSTSINATFDKSEIKLIVAYILQHLHHIFKYCVCIYVSVFICNK